MTALFLLLFHIININECIDIMNDETTSAWKSRSTSSASINGMRRVGPVDTISRKFSYVSELKYKNISLEWTIHVDNFNAQTDTAYIFYKCSNDMILREIAFYESNGDRNDESMILNNACDFSEWIKVYITIWGNNIARISIGRIILKGYRVPGLPVILNNEIYHDEYYSTGKWNAGGDYWTQQCTGTYECNCITSHCTWISDDTFMTNTVSTIGYRNVILHISVYVSEDVKIGYICDNTNSFTYFESNEAKKWIIITENLPNNCDNNGNVKVILIGPGFFDDIYILGVSTENPSNIPTSSPSKKPSTIPTINPTLNPNRETTLNPSMFPTNTPTIYPSVSPINIDNNSITHIPTFLPSNDPSTFPTQTPTTKTSSIPSMFPTRIPTLNPSTFLTNTETPTFSPTVSQFFNGKLLGMPNMNLIMIIIASAICCLITLICLAIFRLITKRRHEPKEIKKFDTMNSMERIKSDEASQTITGINYLDTGHVNTELSSIQKNIIPEGNINEIEMVTNGYNFDMEFDGNDTSPKYNSEPNFHENHRNNDECNVDVTPGDLQLNYKINAVEKMSYYLND